MRRRFCSGVVARVDIASLPTASPCACASRARVGDDAVALVQVEESCKELKGCGPASQVVPSGAVAGFVVAFAPDEVQDFNERVSFVINNNHILNFGVTADVGPILCDIRPPSIFFEFDSDSTDLELSRSTTIVNTSNAPASFNWRQDADTAYSIQPASGVVPPNSSLNCVVAFRPSAKCALDTKMTLVLQGGDELAPPPTLHCNAAVDEPKLVFAAKKVRVAVVVALTACVRLLMLLCGVVYVCSATSVR
jgi:hypothetical protein